MTLHRCKIVADCCEKTYGCRHCHDDEEDHHLEPKNVTQIVCMNCSTKQPITGESLLEYELVQALLHAYVVLRSTINKSVASLQAESLWKAIAVVADTAHILEIGY